MVYAFDYKNNPRCVFSEIVICRFYLICNVLVVFSFACYFELIDVDNLIRGRFF